MDKDSKVETVGTISLGDVISECSGLLDRLSSSDRLKALRAIAAMQGHRVLPGIGIQNQVAPAKQRAKPTAKQRKRQQKTKSPAVAEYQHQIDTINAEIKAESEKLGGARLPDDHDLVVRRSCLFRDLKEARNKPRTSAPVAAETQEADDQKEIPKH
jgi:hypothetical protein